ncbi:hypothetical protein AQUCO_04400070v1 [Aquilegia coerulea]|uniref:Uncharacterized protein n=1 Tax=Aquilegia coerulea TaxID=218851 RepID=A0A2G5CN54_AQUCA|nr:hypothetical protein AQUCO_04400070v1 [Aquilegia coerulea]
MAPLDSEIARIQKERKKMEKQLDSLKTVTFDTDIYYNGSNNGIEGYVSSISVNEDDQIHDLSGSEVARKLASYTAPKSVFEEVLKGDDDIGLGFRKRGRIIDREDEYKRRRYCREISPDRNDPFDLGDKMPDVLKSTYVEVMKEQILRREKEEILREIVKKKKKEEEEEKEQILRRDETYGRVVVVVANATDSIATATTTSMTWDATPKLAGLSTPTPKRQRSRWDETPETIGSATPLLGISAVYNPSLTTTGGLILSTPTRGAIMCGSLTPNLLRLEKDIEERNCPLADEDLDAILPHEGYRILDPPTSYVPILTPARKLVSTPTPYGTPFYTIPEENRGQQFGIAKEASGNLPFIKSEYNQYFGFLTNEEDAEDLSPEEQKRRNIMKLLLKVMNGTPPERKAALRRLTDKARDFGAGPLFNCILPLLKLGTLEDQERHQLVKVVDRVVYKMDELVRPFVHKILVQVGPLLVDSDYYARSEGREVISSLCKAVGLATMISAMRPDIDNIYEDVRRITAKAFSVVASSLGISALLPFLKAVCQSKKSWQARHTGIWMVQEIAILVGSAVLPHLRHLVEIIEHGLTDVNQKVKKITALAIAALAEASHPYGIEGFDSVLKPLFQGIRSHSGNVLATFLKATGFMIRLMGIQVSYYAKEVMSVLVRQFQSSDAEMKIIVLKVLKQCISTEGMEAEYIRANILPNFFQTFWDRRMALDRRNYKQLVETTVEIANKVGTAYVVGRIVEDLKSESEHYRKMVMETIEKIVLSLGASDINARLEVLVIDGILYAFQEQTSEDADVMLNGFGAVVNALGQRVKLYLPQISATIKWRLCNKSAKVRQQAADLISRIAIVMKHCGEEQLMCHLGVVLYESLGEEYPEVLGSILGALKAIVNVIGMTKMTPQIRDLLPCLKPILKNRHEKVQENCIDLVGRIADRGAEFVSAREWMRICFELLEMLKAQKMGIRRATVNTFGYIAKAIGPQDVLATLLNNLKVQARQNRVCTTVAIAIVAETCSPFTVLPSLMNEYRLPELNVQNGILKSLSFLFEYIGEMGKDYIYTVIPLLEDALMDRDLVHRQTAASAVKHMALGVAGLGCEDALVHLLNYVWPNIFDTSPHLMNATMEAIDGMGVALGPAAILNYCLQGLFHPARKDGFDIICKIQCFAFTLPPFVYFVIWKHERLVLMLFFFVVATLGELEGSYTINDRSGLYKRSDFFSDESKINLANFFFLRFD